MQCVASHKPRHPHEMEFMIFLSATCADSYVYEKVSLWVHWLWLQESQSLTVRTPFCVFLATHQVALMKASSRLFALQHAAVICLFLFQDSRKICNAKICKLHSALCICKEKQA